MRNDLYGVVFSLAVDGKTKEECREAVKAEAEKPKYRGMATAMLLSLVFGSIDRIYGKPRVAVAILGELIGEDTAGKWRKEAEKMSQDWAGRLKLSLISRDLRSNSLDFVWLTSAHGDCAKDHLDYQGKYYLERDWRKRIEKLPENERKIVEKWAENAENGKKLAVFEDILFRPVWFISRPYCRHYARLIDVREAMEAPSEIKVRELGMWRETGERYPRERFEEEDYANRDDLSFAYALYRARRTTVGKALVMKELSKVNKSVAH